MELISSDPSACVRGFNIGATVAAFGLLPAVGDTVLARNGITRSQLTQDTMVPLQHWLNALADIRNMLGSEALRAVGRKVTSYALLPRELDTVERVLLALDAVYYANHSGDVGHYRVSRSGADIVIRCETPYPAELEHGLIEGFVANPSLGRKRYAVELVMGDDITHTCTLIVRAS